MQLKNVPVNILFQCSLSKAVFVKDISKGWDPRNDQSTKFSVYNLNGTNGKDCKNSGRKAECHESNSVPYVTMSSSTLEMLPSGNRGFARDVTAVASATLAIKMNMWRETCRLHTHL